MSAVAFGSFRVVVHGNVYTYREKAIVHHIP